MKKYVLAVSGGPDSMAMLHMYAKKTQAVCVVNYKKRENSDLDVKIVVDFCILHNIKYYVYEVPKNVYQEHEKANFQALARQIRYDFFKKTCDLQQNHNLMVAHNLNDHLETAFMQFSRNSRALSYGIQPKSTYLGLKIIRPLIHLQKTTILRYCNQNNVKYAIDYTNELDIYERNRVRKTITAWTPEQFAAFITKVRKYNQKHKKQAKTAQKLFQKWVKANYSCAIFYATSSFYQYYLLYKFLKLNNEKNKNHQKIEAIIEFLKNKNSKTKYRLENNRHLFILENKLVIK